MDVKNHWMKLKEFNKKYNEYFCVDYILSCNTNNNR